MDCLDENASGLKVVPEVVYIKDEPPTLNENDIVEQFEFIPADECSSPLLLDEVQKNCGYSNVHWEYSVETEGSPEKSSFSEVTNGSELSRLDVSSNSLQHEKLLHSELKKTDDSCNFNNSSSSNHDVIPMDSTSLSSQAQSVSPSQLPECYVKLVRLPDVVNVHECIMESSKHKLLEKLGYVRLDENTFCCVACKSIFRNFSQLRKHMIIHSNQKFFQCHLCCKEFRYLLDLKSHFMKTHSNTKIFECVRCHLIFKQKWSLLNHTQVCTSAKPSVYTCMKCKRQFKTKRFFIIHLQHCRKIILDENKLQNNESARNRLVNTKQLQRKEHRNLNEVSMIPNTMIVNEDLSNMYDVSDEVDINELYEVIEDVHIEAKHNQVNEAEPTDIKELHKKKPMEIVKSDELDTDVVDTEVKNRNSDAVRKIMPYCSVCGNDCDLFNMPHKTESSFPCEICGLGFFLKHNLKRHMIVHVDDPQVINQNHVVDNNSSNIQENICDVGSSGTGRTNRTENTQLSSETNVKEIALNNTMDQETLPEEETGTEVFEKQNDSKVVPERYLIICRKPFRCAVCRKDFASKADLKIHMVSHPGEKPFDCPLCQSHHATKSALNDHINSHKKDYLFLCTACNISFKNRQQLQYHCLYGHKTGKTGNQNHEVVVGEPSPVNNQPAENQHAVLNNSEEILKNTSDVSADIKPIEILSSDEEYVSMDEDVCHNVNIIEEPVVKNDFQNIVNSSTRLDTDVVIVNIEVRNAQENRNSNANETPVDSNPVSTKIPHCSVCGTDCDLFDIRHKTKNVYPCEVCGLGFFLKHNLKRHMIVHVDDPQIINQNEIGESVHNGGAFSISNTVEDTVENIDKATGTKKKSISRKQRLPETVWIKEETSDLPEKETNTFFGKQGKRCVCGKLIFTSFDLKHHMKLHKKRFRCKICGISLFSEDDLKIHMVSHPGAKPFVCPSCKSCYATKGSLSEHMKLHKKK